MPWKLNGRPEDWAPNGDEEWGRPPSYVYVRVKSIGHAEFYTGQGHLFDAKFIFYVEYTVVGGARIRRRLGWHAMNNEENQVAIFNYLQNEHVKGRRFEARVRSWQALCSVSVKPGAPLFHADPENQAEPDNGVVLESGAPAGPGPFGIEKVVRIEFKQERFRFLVRYHRNNNAMEDYWVTWEEMGSTIGHQTALWFYLRNDIRTRNAFFDCVRPQ